LSDGNGIHANLNDLGTFATTVDAATTRDFQPEIERLFPIYAEGTTFGAATRSTEVQAARVKHHDALTAMTQTMASLVNVSRVMVDAVNEIRTNYQNADAAAVDEMMRTAVAKAHEVAPQVFSTGADGGQ
jgi:hypothetical protein